MMSSVSSERFLPNNAALGFLEYIFFSHRQDVERASDLVTLVLHAVLLSRDLHLVGDTGQMLPPDWSKCDPIRLRYYLPILNENGEKMNIPPMEKDVVLVCITETAPNVIMSISTGSKCIGHSLAINEIIESSASSAKHQTRYQEAFCNTEALIIELESHLVQPLFSNSLALLTSTSSCSNKKLGIESDDAINALADKRFGPQKAAQKFSTAGANRSNYRMPPGFDYGRRDVDPFAGPGFGSGGMLLDPRFPGPSAAIDPHSGLPLPPGAVPPHARFDPFLPPGVGPDTARPAARLPDPDAPTPLGLDDMYM